MLMDNVSRSVVKEGLPEHVQQMLWLPGFEFDTAFQLMAMKRLHGTNE